MKSLAVVGSRLFAVAALIAALLPTEGAGAAPHPAGAKRYLWPELHRTPSLSGLSGDPGISTSNAAALGVRWMSPVGGTEGSPIVAWNPSLDRALVFSGTTAGYFDAVDADTGSIVWSEPFNSPIVSTPIADGSSVWVAPEASGHIYKLDAATGAVECSAAVPGPIYTTPVLATPPGGQQTIYIGTLGQGPTDGLVYAFATSDCSTIFTWNGYTTPGQDTGVWGPFAYNVDEQGRPLLLFGSANPDSSVYAVNAISGASVWTYDTDNPSGEDWDVGAGVDITAPGVHGFADGVAYVEGKNGILYALNLTTGAPIWTADFGHGSDTDALSTPALGGNTLVFGDKEGILAFDARTGKRLWEWASTSGINSSPAIVGPPGKQAVAFGTVAGRFQVLSLAKGTPLYSYQTGSFISASPADYDGTLLISSDDGFLYDFGAGGGNGASPTTSITSPATSTTVPNPGGRLTVSGTATAPHGVQRVNVEVQKGGTTGPWYDITTDSYLPGLSFSGATVSDPGAPTSDWSLSIPIPSSGGSFLVEASAVDTDGLADISSESDGDVPSISHFTVAADADAPTVTTTAYRIAPAGNLHVSASGFEPGEQVQFTLPLAGGTNQTLGEGIANAAGDVGPIKAAIPAAEPFGPQTITATGESSGRNGVVAVFISNNAPELGYGPQRSGFEPNDTVIENRQSIGPKYLEPAWSFVTSGSIDDTPAIDQGIAYAGDSDGDLSAVSVADGQDLWTASVGSAITSSPAVDRTWVFFGDKAGALVALKTQTGTQAWTADLDAGIPSSPTVSNGNVYVVTSSGTVFDLDESSGAIRWSRQLGAGASASLSLDPSRGVVVVGDTTGALSALSASSGEILWTHHLGGSITATPALGGARVFVGTTKGVLFSLDISDGHIAWKLTTSAAITSAAVLTPQGVGIGNSDGDIYNVSLAGQLLTSQALGSPVFALTATDNIYIAATSAGLYLVRGADEEATINWQYTAANDFVSPVVILNGEVFAGGTNGSLNTFVIPGNPVY